MPDHPKPTNRLGLQKSPYLLQHAYNPVDWYPWGEEAFAKAIQENKPIFLSIGYATCHWCHVMERESFENQEIADLMNDAFVNIKVDREELPDVDQLYMDFAQSMISGATGWPLNLLLTPTLKPFFAMTYLPPEQKYGMLGMKQFVVKIQKLWNSEEKEKMVEQADKIVEVFQQYQHQKGDSLPHPELISIAMEEICHRSDSIYGGIRGAPKFPLGYQISFLIDYARGNSDSRGLFLANKTLEMMHRGGIYDHLGGGFCRYSVDEKWLIPHFEKMLYDNALLLDSYLDGWLVSGKTLYQEVCQEVADYVLNTMTHTEGGFFCAEDSETLGSEGLYYTWNYSETALLLQNDLKDHFLTFYDITPEGNFDGVNVLNTPKSLEEFCDEHKIDLEKTKMQFKNMRTLMLKVRHTREKPFKDDKVLTSWNGLMIHALARTGAALNRPDYVEAAKKAATFLLNHLWEKGILYRRWRDGARAFIGNLDDYALFIRALLTLFEIDADWTWIQRAIELTESVNKQFKIGEIFFQTSNNEEHLILRKCQFSDGSEPSGTAIHCENLLRLHDMTGEEKYLKDAEEILKDVKPYLESFPPGYIYHLKNLLRHSDHHRTLTVVALDENESDKENILRHFFSSHQLHHSLVWLPTQQKTAFPTLQGKEALDGKTTVYLCHHGVCTSPQTAEEYLTR